LRHGVQELFIEPSQVLTDRHARGHLPRRRLLQRERQVTEPLGEHVGIRGGHVGVLLLEEGHTVNPVEHVDLDHLRGCRPDGVARRDEHLATRRGHQRADVLGQVGVVVYEQPPPVDQAKVVEHRRGP
jgi:hypothetical protein